MSKETIEVTEIPEKLARILERGPVSVTRDGQTLGLFIPISHDLSQPPPPRIDDQKREELDKTAKAFHDSLEAQGLTEDVLLADYEKLRAEYRRQRKNSEESHP